MKTLPIPRWTTHAAASLAGPAWVAALLVVWVMYLVGAANLLAHPVQTCAPGTCAPWAPSPEFLANLGALGLPPGFYTYFLVALDGTALVLVSFVAALLVTYARGRRVALLAAWTLLLFSGTTFSAEVTELLTVHPLWWWLGTLAAAGGTALLVVFVYVFPDGRFTPRWTAAAASLWCGVTLVGYFSPTSSALSQASGELFPGFALAFLASGLAVQLWRYRRVSGEVERQQAKWMVFGVWVAVLGLSLALALRFSGVGAEVVPRLLSDALLALAPLALAAALGLAVLRHRLWDIDLILHRTLLYGLLTASVVALYIAVVGALSALLGGSGGGWAALVGTGLVAALVQPLRERLQRGVTHLIYGQRDEPYAVVARLGEGMEATLAPEQVLPTLVRTLAAALRLPYVAVALGADGEAREVVEHGVRPHEVQALPLVHHGEPVGELRYGARPGQEAPTRAERDLLLTLARQASVAVAAVRLQRELRAARERLVAAREEERRRLRRDLHDGLGPQLASLALQLDTARLLLPEDTPAGPVLDHAKCQAQEAVSDVRRIAHDLRPPALDELGLLGAVREWLRPHAGHLKVTLDTPDELPALPAAVEVAALRIIQEAVHNVLKHARATAVRVTLSVGEALELTVSDDGVGLGAGRPHGVGLTSMRERAEELGGTLTLTSPPGEGTCVRAVLPHMKGFYE